MTIKKDAPVRRPDVIKDYIRNLNDKDFWFVQSRLSQRLGGDLGEAVSFLEKTIEIDRFLSGSSTANDYYDRLGHIQAIADNESKRRPSVNSSPRR